jgi:hypothetical protein
MVVVVSAGMLSLASGCSQMMGTSLFNGKDLAGWKAMGTKNAWVVASNVAVVPSDEKRFAMTPGEGTLVNGPDGKTCNICTEQTFGDCEVHIEFVVPKGSNSGVYFQGRYEIQVFDSYRKDKVVYSDCGGIYGRWINNQTVEGHAPLVNASKAPGEWQSFDVTFRAPRFDASGKKIENARFVRVLHNGVLIHQNVELNGPTRAGISETEEVARGPIMLQGDHGPVAYRNIRVRELDLAK